MSASSSEGKTPKFNIVSPITGKAYMAAAHKLCLKDYPLIVPLFINGIAPMEIMEHELPLFRRSLLARKAGRYKDEKGKIAEVHQPVSNFRDQLIRETLRDHSEVCQGDEDAALELLFPSSGKKTRDVKRANIEMQVQTLLQSLMQLYPTEEVVLAMSLDEDLRAAQEVNDLIAWTIAFEKFCISNHGNRFFNVREAEQALKMVKMRGYDTPNYVKVFKQTASEARICGSTQSEEDVVSQFFLNLNQASDAFYRYEFRYLDTSDSLSAFISKPLQAALDHCMAFHNATILTAQARKRTGSDRDSSSTTITSVAELERFKPTKNSVNISHAVFTTLQKDFKKRRIADANANQAERAAGAAAKKAKLDKPTAKPVSKGENDPEAKKKSKVCFRFRSNKGCPFGDDCLYEHVA